MHKSHSPSGYLAQILIPFPFCIACMVMESHFSAKYRKFLSPVLLSSTFFYQFIHLANNLQCKNLKEMIFKCYKSEPVFGIYSTFPITSFIKCKYGTEPPGLRFTLLFLCHIIIRICGRILPFIKEKEIKLKLQILQSEYIMKVSTTTPEHKITRANFNMRQLSIRQVEHEAIC